ncbi:MAG: GNAT family N-acetyltransferase [Pseudomonadota bacterium]
MTYAKDQRPVEDLSRAPESATSSKTSRVLGTWAGLESSFWVLEIRENTALNQISSHVDRLAENCSDANPFFEPSFLAPAAMHLGKEEIRFMCLWEIIGNHRELRLFAPVQLTRTPVRRQKIWRIWSHPYAPVSTPLLDGEANRTVNALSNCIEASSGEWASVILFEALPKSSEFANLLHLEPRLSNRLIRFSVSGRGGITGREGVIRAVSNITGKRKQRLRKAHERLEAGGALKFDTCADADCVDGELQAHLLLEDHGWKSRRGTSILKDEAATKFARHAVLQMAHQGNCRIHTLKQNEKLLASMIMISRHGNYFPWKIAFDENYSGYSVGNLLLSHVNQQITEDRSFVSLDSLASSLNETALRFWPDRIELCSMVIGLGENSSKKALQVASEIEALNDAKLMLKKFLGRSL